MMVKSLESVLVDTDVDGTGFRRKDLWINKAGLISFDNNI